MILSREYKLRVLCFRKREFCDAARNIIHAKAQRFVMNSIHETDIEVSDIIKNNLRNATQAMNMQTVRE
jgi:hypothetical protein